MIEFEFIADQIKLPDSVKNSDCKCDEREYIYAIAKKQLDEYLNKNLSGFKKVKRIKIIIENE